MPIHGLTDRGMAFPEIGSVRKGAKKTDPKRPGLELPHFRVEIDVKEQEAISKFNALYGDTPTSILVILPFDEIDRVWDAWREKYVAGAMIHRCDGKNVQYSINPNTGERVVVGWLRVDNGETQPCQIKDLPKPQCCIPVGRLKVIIPALNRLAYFVVHTTSIHDIINISAQLDAIRTINGGHIAGVPLMLKRVPKEISTPSGDNGKRARRMKYLISIEADPTWVNAKVAALNAAAMPQLAAPVKIEVPRQDAGPDLAALEDFDEDDDQSVPVDGEVIEPPVPVAEVTHAPAPAPAPAPDAIPGVTGATKTVRMALIRFNGMTHEQWHERAGKFCAEHPNWQKDGKPDLHHILASAGHAGFDYIGSDNIDQVFTAIVAAHERKESEQRGRDDYKQYHGEDGERFSK